MQLKHRAALTTSLIALTLTAASVAQAASLQVWIRASNDSRQIYDKVAAAFEAKTGIKIEYFNATTDFEQRLARAAAGSDLPDVIFNDATALGQMVGMGIIEPIDRSKIKGGEDVFDVAWASAKGYDGKTYACRPRRRPSRCSCAATGARSWRCRSPSPGPTSPRSPRRSPTRTRTATARRTPTASSCRGRRRAAIRAGSSPPTCGRRAATSSVRSAPASSRRSTSRPPWKR